MSTEIRPTPETDAADTIPYMDGDELTWWVKKDFARKLERECDSAKTLNRTLLDQLEAQAVQIEAMREAIKEAIPCLDTDRDLTDEQIQGTTAKLIARRAALRKLQPFLKP